MPNKFREIPPEPAVEEPMSETMPADDMQQEPVDTTAGTDQDAESKTEMGMNVAHVIGGDVLKDRWVLRQIPLILLIFIFGILLVANRYRIETLQKEKTATEERISHLREKHIQMQKEYQESIKISRIAQVLDTVGVKLISGPPYEISEKD